MRRKTTLFVSYSHKDEDLADDFVQRLKVQLKPSAAYDYVLWQDKALLVGEDWDHEIRQAMEESNLGLLLVSPAFLGSDYVAKIELPFLLTQPVLPVLLVPVSSAHQDMRGLEEKQIFALEGRAFADAAQDRDRFVATLFEQMEKRLDKSARGNASAERRLVADVAEFSRQAADLGHAKLVKSQAVATTGDAMESGKTLVPFFIAAAPGDQRLARELLEKLKLQLRISRKYAYDAWDQAKVLLGETTSQEQQKAFDRSKFVLVLASPACLGDDDCCRWLGVAKTHGRPFLPVDLKPISDRQDLREMEGIGRFRLDGRSYQECSADQQDHFALKLFEQIEQRLDKHASDTPMSERLKELAPLECCHYVANRSRGVSLDVDAIESPTAETQGQPAVELLLEWATDPKAPPFAAVLGEYGIGKTTTLKQLTHNLLKQHGQDPSTPLPVYVDLRAYSEAIRQHQVPKLEDFLGEVLRHPWNVPHAPQLEVKAVLDLVRTKGGLLIFDGLDEKLVHLDEAQGRAFVRELWGALPPQAFRPGAAPEGTRVGKLLFSCRSHYFKTIRDQASFLCGERRDNIRALDYRACILLPFDEGQVRQYLEQALENDKEKAEAALKLFSQIHNLQDLSRRPYLLSLIVPQIAKLEARRSRGEPVLGVSLYEMLVEEWLNRDDGKHTIQKEDKLRLMEDVAAALWRDGSREWPWSSVRDWLGKRVATDAVMKERYLGTGAKSAILDEDFRTATLVLRPDDSADSFRFAHTSLHEFFLARFLFRALVEGRPQDWALPMPSNETLEFLGQLILCERRADQQDKCKQTLRALLATFVPQATLAAFKYWLLAIERDLPEPSPGRLDLHGADLSEWRIQGRDEKHRLSLRAADLSGAKLSQTRWRWVDLQGANLQQAKLWGAEFLDVLAGDLDVTGADLTATVWRRSSLRDLRGADMAERYAASFVDCRLDPSKLGPDFADLGAYARCAEQGDFRDMQVRDRTDCRPHWCQGHVGAVMACAFSEDGKRFLSGSNDNTLKLWDATSGACLASLTGHKRDVRACAFSPDGRQLLSGSNDSTLKLWDAISGACLASLTGHKRDVRACAFSPDGRWLLSGSDDSTLKLWNAANGVCVATFTGHEVWVRACAFSPDGRWLLSGSDDSTLKLWDAASGGCVATCTGHNGGVTACAFSPDGRWLLSGSDDSTLKLWDAASGACVATCTGHKRGVTACAFSPDGRLLLSGSEDRTLRLWDATSGACLASLSDHEAEVMACAFSPDGRRLLSGSSDGMLKLWDAADGGCLATFTAHRREVTACAFSPDGKQLLWGSDDSTLKLWNGTRVAPLATLSGHERRVRACAFSPDGTRLLSASDDRTMKLWDAASGVCLATFTGHQGWVRACVFSPNGTRFLSGSDDSTLKLWDAASGVCLATFTGHERGVIACAFSPDGMQLLSASYDGVLKMWDATSGACSTTLTGQQGWVRVCAFSVDGMRLFSATFDGTLRLWSRKSGHWATTRRDHQRGVSAGAYSPDGTLLLLGSDDRTLTWWDAERGNWLGTLRGDGGGVMSCAVSPDEKRLASGSSDGTLKLWEAGQEILTLINGPDGEAAAVDFANNRILHASPEAWRFLSWRYFDPKRGMYRLLPGDYFEPFPVG